MVPDGLRPKVLSESALLDDWKKQFGKDISLLDGSVNVVVRAAQSQIQNPDFINLPVDTRLLSSELAGEIFAHRFRRFDAFDQQNWYQAEQFSLNGCRGEEQCNGILYHGDNEQFLLTYGDELQGKVRLLYLDPPYNTGNKQHSYIDSFHRDEWLAMMRVRLQLALPLLSEQGSICVSIDDSEMPYLRVLLDEIVGESNFVACVAYERSGSAGLGQSGAILNTKEYIVIYSLDKRRLNDVGNERPIDRSVMRRYNKVLENPGERELIAEIDGQAGTARLYRHEGFSINSLSIRDFDARRSEIESLYMESFERIFRTQNVQKENTFQNDVISRLEKDRFYSLDYVPARGRYKGTDKTLYYWNGELCAWLKDSSSVNADGITKRNKLTDFWSHAEIPKADLANEGGVLFARSKKPEHLMHRLIALCTNPGELVLDLFAGSGSTTAVAHKMNRRWIGVERGEYFQECTVQRMKRVVSGEQSGVSKLLGWQGGGFFAYLD
jgi:adenine-specific DNA-methyltransferase